MVAINMHRIHVILILIVLVSVLPVKEALCGPNTPSPAVSVSAGNAVRTIRLLKTMSLNELIKQSGFVIESSHVNEFLRDFMRTNQEVTGISSIRKGTLVKLPLRYLMKEASLIHAYKEKGKPLGSSARKDDHVGRAVVSVLPDTELVHTIASLLGSLYDGISVESGGMKFSSFTEKSAISLDSSYFPFLTMKNGDVLVIDYAGILPKEIKEIIREVWPEYSFVNLHGSSDIRKAAEAVLDSLGFFVSRGGKLRAGGRTQIAYDADFIFYKKDDNVMSQDIRAIGIIGKDNCETPPELLDWLKNMDVNVIELSSHRAYHGKNRTCAGKSVLIFEGEEQDERVFIEHILSLMGYTFSSDKILNLSDRKEYSYKLKADLSLTLGKRTSVIEFSELSPNEISYARRRGVDITCVASWEKRPAIIRNILALLSHHFIDSPAATSSYITPRGAKYSLLAPGVFVNSMKGPVFMTDSELEPELIRTIVKERVSIVRF